MKTRVKGRHTPPGFFCNYCKSDSYIISECGTLKRRKEKQNQNNSRPTGLTSLRSKTQSSIQDENFILAKPSATDSILDIYLLIRRLEGQ